MRTLIFLCILSVLALAFASPAPEDEGKKVSKRIFGGFLRKVIHVVKDTFKKIGSAFGKVVKQLKNGVVKVTNVVTSGSKRVGNLITKEGKNFGTFFITSGTGKAMLKIGNVAYQLNEQLLTKAKNTFENQVKNVKFEDVLYKVFPILKADAKDCKQAVGIALAAAGAGAAAKAAEPVYGEVCKIRQHIVDSLKDEITHG